MKTKSTLLLYCFLIKAPLLITAPMWTEEKSGETTTRLLTSEQQTAINRRQEERLGEGDPSQYNTRFSTATDETNVEEQHYWTIHSSIDFVDQKIAAIQEGEQKWELQMRQWNVRLPGSIKAEEKVGVRAAAVTDLDYWSNQSEQATACLSDDRLDEVRREQYSRFVNIADQVTAQIREVISYCDSLSDSAKPNRLTFLSTIFPISTATSSTSFGSKSRPTSGSCPPSPSSLSTKERVEHLVAVVHAAAHQSGKSVDFEKLDQRFLQTLEHWVERENARLKYEAAVKEHERAKEELALQKSIHDATNIEETLPAQVSRCARICSYIFGCINTPCFDVAAFFTGVAGVADEVGKEIIDHPLHQAEALEKRAATKMEESKKLFEEMQEEAPGFHQETERLEQEARAHEKENIIEFIQGVIPPTADGEEIWNTWAAGIKKIVNIDELWTACLARYGESHPDWAQELVKKAFQQRVQYLEQYLITLKNKESSDQREKERLGKEALAKREAAAAAKKTVMDHQQQMEQLTVEVNRAREALQQANQELNELEKKPLAIEEGSKKGIDSMDASLQIFNQQWTKIKKAKEELEEKEAELAKVKAYHQQAAPIAAEREIDFNKSLQKYQHHGEKLDRHIERAAARLAANRQAMEPLLDSDSEEPFIQQIVGIADLPFDVFSLSSKRQGEILTPVGFPPLVLPSNITRDISDGTYARNEIDQLTRAESYDHHDGKETERFPSTQSNSSGSPFKEARGRKSSFLGTKESVEFEFPAVNQLPEKSYEYLQQLSSQRIDTEEKESDDSSNGGIFRRVESIPFTLQRPGEDDGEVGLPLTPLSEEGKKQQQSFLHAQKEAVRKSPGEALADWDTAIQHAKSLVESYRQIIEANQKALADCERHLSLPEGQEPISCDHQQNFLEQNQLEAEAQKANWMIKIHSLEASRACDLAVHTAMQPFLKKSVEAHQQEIAERYQKVIQSYEVLEDFCRAMLKEHPKASSPIQSSWVKKLEEAIQEKEQWKLKIGSVPRRG